MRLDETVRHNYLAWLTVGVMWTVIGIIWLYLGLTTEQGDAIFDVDGRIWLGSAAVLGALSVLFIAYRFRARYLD
jgi:hypothetical protein